MNHQGGTQKWQFSLRTAMIALLVMGCILGLLAYRTQRLAQQQYWSNIGLEVVYDDANRLKTVIGFNISLQGHKSIDDWRLEPSIQQILLHNTDLGDGQLRGVELLPHLEVLMLSASHITDKSSSTLRQCKQVKTLNLAYTIVSDESIDDIAKMPSLSLLETHGSRISISGIDRLHTLRKESGLPQVTIPPPPKKDLTIVPLTP